MEQISCDVSALSTVYVFRKAGVELTLTFTTPLLMDDLYVLSRPCSYLNISSKSIDGNDHDIKLKFDFSDELCINKKASWKRNTAMYL